MTALALRVEPTCGLVWPGSTLMFDAHGGRFVPDVLMVGGEAASVGLYAVAPKTWMARSATDVSSLAPTTLIAEISGGVLFALA